MSDGQTSSTTWTRGAALVVFAVTALAFLPALGATWVRWDDTENFLAHDAWRGVGAEQATWAFTTFHMGPYQPLAWLSLGLDHELWGLDARGFHATNVLIHALAAVAVFAAALELFRAVRTRALPADARHASGSASLASMRGSSPAHAPQQHVFEPATDALRAPTHELTVRDERDLVLGAALCALLFAVHPLRAESVAWITERRDVLCGLFFALAIRAWLVRARSSGAQARKAYATAFAFTLMALLSKASAMVLPAVFLVLDAWPLRRLAWRKRAAAIELVPFAGLSIVFAALAWHGQSLLPGTLRSIGEHDVVARVTQASYALGFYAWKTVLPTGLSPIYDLDASFPRAEHVVVACGGIALGVACFALRKRAPAVSWAFAAYALVLAPTSGLAQAGPQLVADRYSYFACLPWAALAGGAWIAWTRRSPSQRTYAAQVAGGVVLLLGAACWRQTLAWRDTESLWQRALAVAPDSPNALQNLGAQRLRDAADATEPSLRRAKVAEARALLARGFELAPSPEVRVNLGVLDVLESEVEPARASELVERGIARIADGIALGDVAGRTKPGWRFQLALALAKAGRWSEVARELEALGSAGANEPEVAKLLARAREELERDASTRGR